MLEYSSIILFALTAIGGFISWLYLKISSIEKELLKKPTEQKVILLIDLKQKAILDRHIEIKDDINELRVSIDKLSTQINSLLISVIESKLRDK